MDSMAMMTLALATIGVAARFVTFVINASNDVLDVAAPSKEQASTWAKMWVDSVDNPLISDQKIEDPNWDGVLQKQPLVRMEDRSLHSQVWTVALSLPPEMSGKYAVVPYDVWAARSTTNPLDGTNWEWVLSGYEPANLVRTVCTDAPGYSLQWQTYRFYYVTVYAYTWYVEAPDKDSALAQSRKFWLTNGIWKPGRRVGFDEWRNWNVYWRKDGAGKPPPPFDVPKLPWERLLASTVVNPRKAPAPGAKIQRCRFRQPDAIDFLSEKPFVAESPVDFRIPPQ